MYVGMWMTGHADIVDKYGNRVHTNCEVSIQTSPCIDVTAVHVQEGQLQFQTRAEEIGTVEFCIVLKEQASEDEISSKKDAFGSPQWPMICLRRICVNV